MAEKNQSKTRRRDILKKAGAGSLLAGAIPILSDNATATKGFKPNNERQKVKSIVEALPETNFYTYRADVSTQRTDEGIGGITHIEIPADTGGLNIIRFRGTGYSEVIFNFDEHVPEIAADWPEGTDAYLKGTESGTTFTREITEPENRSIADDLEI